MNHEEYFCYICEHVFTIGEVENNERFSWNHHMVCVTCAGILMKLNPRVDVLVPYSEPVISRVRVPDSITMGRCLAMLILGLLIIFAAHFC
jgi:hypothetical protein